MAAPEKPSDIIYAICFSAVFILVCLWAIGVIGR